MRAPWATSVAIRAAWSCLRQHPWRSALSLSLCGLGIAGVLIAGFLAEMQLAEVQVRLRRLGGGLLIVSPNQVPPYPGRSRQLEHFISLLPEDAAALTDKLPQVQTVVPVAARTTVVRTESTALRVRVVGTTPDLQRIRGFTPCRGRFLRTDDGSERVIVLGHAVSQELLPGGVRPGHEVYLGAAPYLVIGVLEPQGVNFAGEDEDHQAFIPLETYQRRIANRPWLHHLYLQLAPNADAPQTAREVQQLVRTRHGRTNEEVDDIIVRDLAELAAEQSGLLSTATWAVFVTSGLLLAMGVIGIASLMLLIVRQRRGEIGLRRALGATPGDIALQFFIEGITVAATGVLVGLVLGLGTTLLLSRVWAAPLNLNPVFLAVSAAVCLGASALACVLPAVLAARTEPGIALRP